MAAQGDATTSQKDDDTTYVLIIAHVHTFKYNNYTLS